MDFDITLASDGTLVELLDGPLVPDDEPTLTLLLTDTAIALELIARSQARPDVRRWLVRVDAGVIAEA